MGTTWDDRQSAEAASTGTVRFDRTGAHLVIRLAGEIDDVAVRRMRARTTEVVDRETAGPITVDLSAVTFIDSSGLGLIAGLHHRSRRLGPLEVRGARGMVRHGFRVTGLDGAIEVRG